MTVNINSVISEIINILNATSIPNAEVQNFNPPQIPINRAYSAEDFKVKKIWNGGDPETNNKINKIDKIKPIINEKNILSDVLADNDDGPWGSSNTHGMEAIAWYKSFHISSYWGIYISYSGLLRYAKKFHSEVCDEKTSLELAWDGIMAHESVHYAVDVACARIEIIVDTPIYLPGKLNAKSTYGYSVDEERLAEGALLRYFKSKRNDRTTSKNYFGDTVYDIALRNSKSLPKGYSEGYQASTMLSFKHYSDKYISELVNNSLTRKNNLIFEHLELANLMPLKNNHGGFSPGYIDWTECPIYIVDDSQYTGLGGGMLSFLTSISYIQESQKFIKKISPKYINSWKETKNKLSDPIVSKNSTNLDLQRWRKEDDKLNKTKAWSVRVGGRSANMRAHIDENLETGVWIADRFGNADEMGHHKNR